jgi:hypothetical protein
MAAYYEGTVGALSVFPRGATAGVALRRMRIELYRLFHWVAIAALVVWTVYSAYSALIFS